MISFSRKVQYWISQVEQNYFECFPVLTEFLQESETELDTETINDIKVNLAGLSESPTMYSSNLEYKEHCWVQNPFRVTEKLPGFPSADYEVIEMTSDTQLKTNFEEVPLDIFWGSLYEEYPEISKQSIKILLPFATTYRCESGFS